MNRDTIILVFVVGVVFGIFFVAGMQQYIINATHETLTYDANEIVAITAPFGVYYPNVEGLFTTTTLEEKYVIKYLENGILQTIKMDASKVTIFDSTTVKVEVSISIDSYGEIFNYNSMRIYMPLSTLDVRYGNIENYTGGYP